MSDKRAARRRETIHAYVGANGSGKSLAMVWDTIPSLEQERRILSTVRICDPKTGEDHPLWEPLTRWGQLLDFEHGDVLLDEVQGVASSRGHQSLPPAILSLFLQLRRRDVVLRMTAPSFARADLVLREVTQAVTYCRGFRPERGSAQLWAPNRLFLWRTYNALDFDEFSQGQRERLTALQREWHWRPRHDAHHYYDTYDAVTSIEDANEAGSCMRCGGRRTRPKCECPPASSGSEHEAVRPRAQPPTSPRPRVWVDAPPPTPQIRPVETEQEDAA